MTVRHMKIFLEVYRTQNITRAAELLYMTQPAVTRAIQELERYYGVRLFERINHRLYATETAKQLYPQALHLADGFDRMEKGLRNWDEFGLLRVGASITLGNFLLPELVSSFRKKHEHLRVTAIVSNGAHLTRALLDNHLDLALIEGGVSEEHLHLEPFSHDCLLPVFPPDHPLLQKEVLSLADLAECDLLLREEGSAGRTFLNHVFEVHGMHPVPMWESASTQAIVKAVSAGLGISLLPRQLVEADIRSGTVATRPVADESFARTHYIVWHENKFLTASALDFIALAKQLGESSL